MVSPLVSKKLVFYVHSKPRLYPSSGLCDFLVGPKDGPLDGQMDGPTDGPMGGQTDGHTLLWRSFLVCTSGIFLLHLFIKKRKRCFPISPCDFPPSLIE